jgi:DNA-binding response OmpR family regulator
MSRILVADDDADICRLVAFTLQREGHDVLTAANGNDALALAVSDRPDLAILDVLMPGLGGIDLVRALSVRSETARVPVVLLSALTQATEVARGIDAGAVAYLIKPFDPLALATRVETILASRAGASLHD